MDLEDPGDGEADWFRDDDPYLPEPSGPAGQPEQEWAPSEGPLRVVPASEASALLRIKLPDSPPVPATTLRSDAPPLDRVQDAATMWTNTKNPARPTALPGDVVALTTATMVVPVPDALNPSGANRSGQRNTLLTASVPPDSASRAEAGLLSDTVEQFFGDFDAIGRELAAERAGLARSAGSVASADPVADGAAAVGARVAGFGSAAEEAVHAIGARRPQRTSPAGEEHRTGRYGVPTQVPGYDAARRGPVGMRYLGGIFHDSSGESSFYDPQTASLVPMSAFGPAAIEPEHRRQAAPSEPGPARPNQTAQLPAVPSARRSAPAAPPRSRPADPADEPDRPEHWEDHHPDHHRTKAATPGRRRARILLVSAVAGALVLGGVYGAAVTLGGQVPKGTMVDGVDIGGLSRTAAQTKLAAALGPGLTAPIRLTADGTTLILDPAQSGLTADWAATVEAAAAGRDDPFVAIPAMVGSRRSFGLRTWIDRKVLRAALVKAAAGFDKPMIEGGVTFPGGVPTPVAPRPGRAVDIDAAVENVANAFENGAAALGAGDSARSAGISGQVMSGGDLEAAAYVVDMNPPSATPSRKPSPTASPSSSKADTATPSSPVSSAPPATIPAAPAATPDSTSPSVIPPITLAVRTLQPTVTPAEVARVMQDVARPAMSAPVVLVTGSVRTTLKPPVLGKYLAIVPDGHGALVPRIDGAGVRTEIDQAALAKLEQPAVDAGFGVVGGRPVLVPGKTGEGYAPQAISDAILPVLTKTQTSQRTVTVPAGPLPPALTTEAAQALDVRDVMGTYTEAFTATSQRSANVRHAADLLRGQIVQPGATFSLNQALGARTTADGFVPAKPSGSGAQDAGGGCSLVATALFNAEYQAGLKDVEHHPHASLTDRFPAGLEAASAYPDVDLKFQNDSASPVYLWTQTTDSTVTVAVLGQKDFTSVQTEMSQRYGIVPPKTVTGSSGSCTATEGVAGFQIDVTRILVRNGEDPVREVFHTAYAPQDKVVCPPPASAGSANGAGPQASASQGSNPTPEPGATTGASGPPGTSGEAGGVSPGPTYPTPAGPSSSPPAALLGGLLGAPPRH